MGRPAGTARAVQSADPEPRSQPIESAASSSRMHGHGMPGPFSLLEPARTSCFGAGDGRAPGVAGIRSR